MISILKFTIVRRLESKLEIENRESKISRRFQVRLSEVRDTEVSKTERIHSVNKIVRWEKSTYSNLYRVVPGIS